MRLSRSWATGPVVATLAAVAVLVAGCSSGSGKPSSVPQTSAPRPGAATSTTTTTTTLPPTPATAATGTAEELQVKLIARGLCEEAVETPPYRAVLVSGLVNCKDGYAIATFPTDYERDYAIRLIGAQPCQLPSYLVVGDLWIIWPLPATRFAAEKAQEVLGGELRELPCLLE